MAKKKTSKKSVAPPTPRRTTRVIRGEIAAEVAATKAKRRKY